MVRATATVLFTDLVRSTELWGRLGEEAADELRRRHDRALTDAVEQHGGRVVKGLGDGIMATFGGASDALSAAVAIQQTVQRLNRSMIASEALSVRVGLSAGDVTFEDDDAHGTPVIEASRFCGIAEGDTILTSEVVRLLATKKASASPSSTMPTTSASRTRVCSTRSAAGSATASMTSGTSITRCSEPSATWPTGSPTSSLLWRSPSPSLPLSP